jgi:hypothetical protein
MDDDNDDNDNSEGDDIDDSEEDSDDDDDEEESEDDEIDIEDEINVEQFTRTFHNGDYDQEFDIALSSDRNVTLPNQPTQASYNKPENWQERNRIGLEIVKEQLQNCIDHMSHDACFNLDLRHNDEREQLRDNEEPIVWHESIFDEYWNKLEADWRNQQDIVAEIEGIHIENVEITRERLAALVDICNSGRANSSSRRVVFNNASICKEGIVSLSKLIEASSELQYFYLEHNRIDNMESARCLSTSLKSHTRIIHLDLSHCDLGSTPEILSVILQSDVEYIYLNNNNIGSLGAAKIAEYLESDPPIKGLFLVHNRLNDDDAVRISQSLKSNTNLHEMYLRSNNFTCIGVKALINCVFDSSSLNAISESNHRLGRMIIFSEEGYKLQVNQIQKIILALNDKDSLPQYLANVPVELIPKVLVFSQQHGCQLNSVYSTMRWWNMPLLYSYYSCVKSDTKRKRSI